MRPSRVPFRPAALLSATLLLGAVGLLTACGDEPEGRQPQVGAPPAATPSPPTTSATPSPGPSPTGATGNGAEWPNADTTGVEPGVRLTKRTGQIFVKKSGTVIQNIDLLGDVRIEANNVTVRNVRIRNPSSGGPTYWGILQWEGYKGLVVEHVDIIGSTKEEMTKGIDNLGGMVTVRYSDISGISKKAIDTQHGLIENNYLHDPHHFPQADGEVDMIRVTGGPAKGLKLVVRNNTIINTLGGTAAMGIYSDTNNPCHDILFEHNFLGGGGYTLYAGGQDDPTYNLVIKDNVFSTKVKPGFGPAIFFNGKGRGNVWRNNKWQSGRTVPVP
ncbi:hypothetical protein [Luedemannella flava]|uniref:hypothetical protein n=1 Tax=Luedemannella flava TaxID=349316 RepID=UPI0031D6C473